MKAKGFCLLLLLLLLPCIGMAETHTVENEGYALTIDGETMALTMLDKASGKLYTSGADPDSVSGNAAWKGFLQLFSNPHHWEKTKHFADPNAAAKSS